MVQYKRDLDTLIAISYCHYQRLGLCHYFKALNLFFESFVIIYNCLWKFYFLIAFLFFLLLIYYCFLFIIVFDAIYMLLILHVLCFKIEFFCWIFFILKSPDILRDFPCLQSRLWWKICWCVVLSLSNQPHTIGAKRFNLGFFLSSWVWSLTFWRSYKILKIF